MQHVARVRQRQLILVRFSRTVYAILGIEPLTVSRRRESHMQLLYPNFAKHALAAVRVVFVRSGNDYRGIN